VFRGDSSQILAQKQCWPICTPGWWWWLFFNEI